MLIELVLLRPGQLPGEGAAMFASEAARSRSVESITTALVPYRNVLFDLYNEHDHPGGRISHAAGRALRDRVKTIDPARIVTISSTGSHLMGNSGQVDANQKKNLLEEAGTGQDAVGVDVVTPHFPRTDDWAAATGGACAAFAPNWTRSIDTFRST